MPFGKCCCWCLSGGVYVNVVVTPRWRRKSSKSSKRAPHEGKRMKTSTSYQSLLLPAVMLEFQHSAQRESAEYKDHIYPRRSGDAFYVTILRCCSSSSKAAQQSPTRCSKGCNSSNPSSEHRCETRNFLKYIIKKISCIGSCLLIPPASQL